jgi:hypothetical protein
VYNFVVALKYATGDGFYNASFNEALNLRVLLLRIYLYVCGMNVNSYLASRYKMVASCGPSAAVAVLLLPLAE